MNSNDTTDGTAKPRGWIRRGLRILCLAALGVVLLVLTLWAVAALYIDVRVPWLRGPLAAV
jgi:hypothetical protein